MRLLELARLIRCKGTLEEAEAVLPYEQQLAKDLEACKAEIQPQPKPLAA